MSTQTPDEVRYPDIFDNLVGKTVDDNTRKATQRDNTRNRRVYLAVRQVLMERFASGSSTAIPAEPRDFPGSLDDQQKASVLAIVGMMHQRGFSDPTMGRNEWNRFEGDVLISDQNGPPDHDNYADPAEDGPPYHFRAAREFIDQVIEAVKEFNAHTGLYVRIVERLQEVATRRENPLVSDIWARHVAEIGARLVQEHVDENHAQLKLLIDNVLVEAISGLTQRRALHVDIDLPDLDLDAGSASDVIPENVMALSAVYMAAMLEEMRYFQVADLVAQQFMRGMLPVSRGIGGQKVFDYIKNGVNRFNEQDRRELYARAFGFAQGGVDVELPNREFQDLWVRFLSATSVWFRQSPQEKLRVSPEQLHKAARDLAVNLSMHGYAISHFFAAELQGLIKDVGGMLNHPDVVRAFGVRDQWQLVDRVAQVFLGSSVNTVRYRTMARAGGKVIQWLGRNSAVVASPFAVSGLEVFNDMELVDYAERWLAVTGTQDSTVEQFSEPVVAGSQPTLPALTIASAPQAIEDALEQVSAGAVAPDVAV
ncbi:MAG: hypothetical protein OXT09_03985 [Myxococcales bacterium]|nr:hypothetical protein [Myxococcales bacterium]